MPIENYERIVDKIANISKSSKEEIERKIEAKRAKLSGLISKEGAAQIVAAELGISFDNEKLKIQELLSGMSKVNVVGKVISLFPVRSFKTKKGDEGKVANLVIADETSNIKVVLWDTNAIALIERGDILEGKTVEIINGSMRDNEIHLGSFSEIKLSDKEILNVNLEKSFKEKKISELKNSDHVKIRAFIMQSFEPKFFYVCPSCSKKVTQEDGGFVCLEHGKVPGEKRALISLVLDDGTETIRTVVFQDNIADLEISLDNPEEIHSQKEALIGKEFVFHGTVRNNKLFNTPEMIIEKIEKIDLDNLIKELEN